METMEAIEEQQENKEIQVVRTPLFGRTYATNALVAITDCDVRIELMNEKFQHEDKWIYHSDHMAILTMQAAKKLLLDLNKKISKYEEENGEIEVNSDRLNVDN